MVQLTVNGVEHSLDLDADARLLDVLRERLALRATRFGCGANQCGACHVLVDGRAVASCDTPMWVVAGKRVTTLEGLGAPDMPAGLREAFVAEQAAQCGYCLSGMLMSAADLLLRDPAPSEATIRSALDRNLCRCGSHNRIVRAIARAARTAGAGRNGSSERIGHNERDGRDGRDEAERGW